MGMATSGGRGSSRAAGSNRTSRTNTRRGQLASEQVQNLQNRRTGAATRTASSRSSRTSRPRTR